MESELSGSIKTALDWIDFTTAALTNIGCFYLLPVMVYWWWRLRESSTNLRPLIEGIAEVKAGIWLWSASQLLAITFFGADLPLWSLPSRILIMFGIWRHVYVTSRIKPAPRIEDLPGPFERVDRIREKD